MAIKIILENDPMRMVHQTAQGLLDRSVQLLLAMDERLDRVLRTASDRIIAAARILAGKPSYGLIPEPVAAIWAEKAVVCANCDHVTDSSNRCKVCGSYHIIPILVGSRADHEPTLGLCKPPKTKLTRTLASINKV